MDIPEFKLERYFARWEFVAPFILYASDIEGHPMHKLLSLADDNHFRIGIGRTSMPDALTRLARFVEHMAV